MREASETRENSRSCKVGLTGISVNPIFYGSIHVYLIIKLDTNGNSRQALLEGWKTRCYKKNNDAAPLVNYVRYVSNKPIKTCTWKITRTKLLYRFFFIRSKFFLHILCDDPFFEIAYCWKMSFFTMLFTIRIHNRGPLHSSSKNIRIFECILINLEWRADTIWAED